MTIRKCRLVLVGFVDFNILVAIIGIHAIEHYHFTKRVGTIVQMSYEGPVPPCNYVQPPLVDAKAKGAVFLQRERNFCCQLYLFSFDHMLQKNFQVFHPFELSGLRTGPEERILNVVSNFKC